MREVENLGAASVRPTAPDREMLEAASTRLTQRLGLLVENSWDVVGRFDRSRSTVFRLRNSSTNPGVQIFYKAYIISGGKGSSRSGRIQRVRQALLVESQLAGELGPALAEECIHFDEPLALDPERLVAVRMSVSGKQLGKALSYAMPGQRNQGRYIYRKVGLALRIIEGVGSQRPPPSSARVEHEILKNLDSSARYLTGSQRTRLEKLIALYLEAVDIDEALVWTHGDASQSNILKNGKCIGVIDFTWSPKLRCSDLTQLVVRLETEAPRSPRWTTAMCREVMDGFGIDPEDPGYAWRLAYLDTAIRAIRRKRPRVQSWGKNALDQLGVGA